MKCHGIVGVTPEFINKLFDKYKDSERLEKHFLFFKLFKEPERGAFMPLYFVRKNCKHDKNKIFTVEDSK